MRRRIIAIVASLAVIGAAVSVIVLSWVPLPDFVPLEAGIFLTSIAYIDEDNCLQVADLGRGTVSEFWCESERGWIDGIAWTESGVEMTIYLNQPTTKVFDSDTGELIETRAGDRVGPPATREGLLVDSPDRGGVVVYDEEGDELLVLNAPERYWIEAALPSPDGHLIAIADSHSRLAVFALEGPGASSGQPERA